MGESIALPDGSYLDKRDISAVEARGSELIVLLKNADQKLGASIKKFSFCSAKELFSWAEKIGHEIGSGTVLFLPDGSPIRRNRILRLERSGLSLFVSTRSFVREIGVSSRKFIFNSEGEMNAYADNLSASMKTAN